MKNGLVAAFSLFFAVLGIPAFAETRTWTDTSGRNLEAEFLSFSEGSVEIKRTSDGQVFKLPLKNFSVEDQEYVRAQMQTPQKTGPGPVGESKFQIGDPDPKFDESKFDPNYPQMKVWRQAGVSTGIPQLQDQLDKVTKEFQEGTTEEELRAYLESPNVKYKSAVVLLKNGTYHFSDKGIRIYSSATLIGESRDGVAIHLSGQAGVSLYNAKGAGLRNVTLVGVWKDSPPDPLSFDEDLEGMRDHRSIHMGGCVDSFVDNVRILNSASHPIWIGGNNNTIRNLDVDGAYCKGGGCQGYFFIDGHRNLITGCKVTQIRHISLQNPTSKENVFYNNDVRQEVSFHTNDGGDNLIENNRITIPRKLTAYNAIMGPWSTQHKVGGLNFIYNNTCEEENNRKKPWSDTKLYVGPHFVSNSNNKERYDNFTPAETPPPKGGTLYPIIVNP
jgi:hypothetical protein